MLDINGQWRAGKKPMPYFGRGINAVFISLKDNRLKKFLSGMLAAV
jgi:hypothetical protein